MLLAHHPTHQKNDARATTALGPLGPSDRAQRACTHLVGLARELEGHGLDQGQPCALRIGCAVEHGLVQRLGRVLAGRERQGVVVDAVVDDERVVDKVGVLACALVRVGLGPG